MLITSCRKIAGRPRSSPASPECAPGPRPCAASCAPADMPWASLLGPVGAHRNQAPLPTSLHWLPPRRLLDPASRAKPGVLLALHPGELGVLRSTPQLRRCARASPRWSRAAASSRRTHFDQNVQLLAPLPLRRRGRALPDSGPRGGTQIAWQCLLARLSSTVRRPQQQVAEVRSYPAGRLARVEQHAQPGKG